MSYLSKRWPKQPYDEQLLSWNRNLDNRVVYDVIVKAQNQFGMSQPSDLFNFYVNYKGTSSTIVNYKGISIIQYHRQL